MDGIGYLNIFHPDSADNRQGGLTLTIFSANTLGNWQTNHFGCDVFYIYVKLHETRLTLVLALSPRSKGGAASPEPRGCEHILRLCLRFLISLISVAAE